ncbi:YihY/virulence factor BrkB family protein [Azospirillum rugosum]|uniref:Membrane protein n=1 Tax=Azospirillum rugosum TaxID=416170 RepID=A0ABS4SEH9_9PROT|nr:YihY/virulence factor BrkB family protein [Azospirillum rugosum]MBP2290468.1 membrane protein [Azospirillum rugosum]MDQ0525356.1 membrane protein [Azospirillum rugosum]
MLGLSRRHHYNYPRVQMEDGRGRSADKPSDIPKAGWKDILWRTWEQQGKDNISIVAAGVAYYALFAIFPAIAALVSIYGLLLDPAGVERQIGLLADFLPPDALKVLSDQAHSVATAPRQGLGFGVLFGFALTLWSASRGTNSLITALNIAYGEEERRSFFRLALISLGLTIAGLLFLIVTLGLIVAVPAVINLLGLQDTVIGWVASLARWPILAVAIMFVLAVLYRYGPDRREPKWRWVSWGSAAATILWILASVGFSLYVSHFGSYNQTYGSVGAGVVLLLWFNLTSYVILMGAELNAEIEHQTARDTTDQEGRGEKPLGTRDAYVADTVGRRRA